MKFSNSDQEKAISTLIAENFNLNEMQLMCIDLDLPDRILIKRHYSLPEKAKSICALAHITDTVKELLDYCAKNRSNAPWWNVWRKLDSRKPNTVVWEQQPDKTYSVRRKTEDVPETADVLKIRLYVILDKRCSLSDLEDISFRSGIDWDVLDGGTDKRAKIRALLIYCANRKRLDDLTSAIHESRPDIDF